MRLSKHLQGLIEAKMQQRDADRARAEYMRSQGIEWPPKPTLSAEVIERKAAYKREKELLGLKLP